MTAERRLLKRDYFQVYDRMSVKLISESAIFSGSVIEFNSFGMSLVPIDANILPSPGDTFKVEIYQENAKVGEFRRGIVVSCSAKKISIRACTNEQTSESNQRLYSRTKLASAGFPQMSFENSVKFNDVIVMKIVELSLSGGVALTSVRNRTIVPGMEIQNTNIRLFDKDFVVPVRISNVRIDEAKENLLVGFSFVDSDQNFLQALFEQILRFGREMSPELFKELRLAAGGFKHVKDHIEYGLARTEEEFESVLRLRLAAYGRVGKVDESKHWKDMADEFDSRSLVLIGKFKGKVVASGRLTFAGKSDIFELETSIQLPEKFLVDRTKVIEVSRLCVDENFLSTNLIHGIFEWGFQYCVKSGVEWVISSTEMKLAHIYKKIGFTVTKKDFELVTLKGKRHFFMYGNMNDVVSGKMNWIAWSISFGKVLQFLEKRNFIQTSSWVRFKHVIAGYLAGKILKFGPSFGKRVPLKKNKKQNKAA